MKCPNCGTEFEPGYICPACKADAPLFSKTASISDSLYNEGLAKAKDGDMTGAAGSLAKSLAFNKNNVAARNLIGLVYFEMGRVGGALREWRISASLLKDENPALGYIRQMESNPRQVEKLDDTVRMYNNAFDYIRQKSDDMAIIQLKKAIDLNPGFVDALNLLTLCHLMRGENDKAAAVIEKTLAADINNPLALHYLKMASPSKPRADFSRLAKRAPAVPAIRLQPPAQTEEGAGRIFSFGRSFSIAGVISFLLGGLGAFAVLYILIVPEKIAVKQREIETLQNERVAEVQLLKKEIEDGSAQLEGLRESDKAWQEKYGELQAQNEINAKTNQILGAERSLDHGEYQEAVDAVAAMPATGLPTDLLERAQNIKDEAYPKLMKKYYDDGVRLYNARRYDEAGPEFENAQKYAQTDNDIADDILWYLGRVALFAEDTDSARDYFQRVVDEYPNGNRAADAKNRLRQLG